ncbi:MAG: type II toxin-antitoxin system PemK/MazF family toxin [Thermodesulfobacteriota bacterium]|nr:type II toxin-antitoxin system PemK/MazF family toxin [Thermodesulfobacteriota bacterium]
MVKPRQGDIYWVRFGVSRDSGPSGKRPAIVIQNNLLNISGINTTVVALLTSNLKLGQIPGNVSLLKGTANLAKASVVVVSQIATVDKNRLIEKIGTLSSEKIKDVIKGCQMVISLSFFSSRLVAAKPQRH